MQFSVYMVCGHCGTSEPCAEGIDVLVCTLALMPWQCSSCSRQRSLVVKPSSDADTN